MRLRIDTSSIEFRIASAARPRMESKDSQVQKKTPPSDGSRPIWNVRVTAFDKDNSSTEMIWVEVAGDEPQVTPNEVATITGLVFAPWVNRKGEIMRAFRAESVAQASGSRRAAA
jgi:hypothetical protein